MSTLPLNASVTIVTNSFERALAVFQAASDAIRAFGIAARLVRIRKHRSGHRHRGTVDWRLRYAPARKDVPLGMRTQAKREALR